jgi:hypothetical protein
MEWLGKKEEKEKEVPLLFPALWRCCPSNNHMSINPTQAWDRVSDTKQKANRACLEEMDTWEVEIHMRETNHGKFFIRSCKGSCVTKDTATLFTL